MIRGHVKWFSDTKGYGFVNADDDMETDIFVHFSQINGEGYKSLVEGQRVTFELMTGPKGVYAGDVNKLPLTDAIRTAA